MIAAPEVMTAAFLPAEEFDRADFDRYVMGTYARFPIALERGEGCRVWDTEGKSYLDFVAGIATCTLGHSHPAIAAAVQAQMQTLQHVSNLYYTRWQGALAQWLVENSAADRVFFCNSGAEANEGAIKLARKYAHKVLNIDEPVILSAHSSFHGRTLATVTATGQPKYQKPFTPLPTGFDYIPYNDLPALQAALVKHQGKVCAVLIEPLQGEGGVRPGDREYFQGLRALCDEHRLLLMVDEVQAGMGRTGKLWGYENLGIVPDVITTAKGLGGGFPIGAMLCRESCNVFDPGDHASTFGGNPLACRVGYTVCETLVRENLLANVRDRGEQLQAGLRSLVERYPQICAGERGWGLLRGLVLPENGPVQARDVVAAAIAEGLLLVPAGTQVVRFVPPLIVTAVEMAEALDALERAIGKLAAAHP